MTASCVVDRLLEAVSRERIQFYAQHYQLPEKEVEDIGQHDPSSGKYLNWILKQFKAGRLRFPEDGDKTQNTLSEFQKLSRKPAFTGKMDINSYLSYGELARTVEANREIKTKGEIVRSAEMEGCKLLDQQGEDKLYMVTTQEAAAKVFRHTEWCIKDPKWFNKYDPKRFYYVERNRKPFQLLHIESHQLKDVYDDYSSDKVPILEPYIAKSTVLAYAYAKDVLHGRFPAGEEAISTSAAYAYCYACLVAGKRFKAGEETISKDSFCACQYAINVIRGRWPKGEPAINKDRRATKIYVKFLASLEK